MDGRPVEANGRALSRRMVAKGLGGGAAATLAALSLQASALTATAQGATPSGTAQAILDAWTAAWSSGSSENVAALFTEDGVYEDVPFEERVMGRAAIAEYAQGYFDLAQEVALSVETAVAIPKGYVVQWHDEYTFAPTGGRVSYRGISILEVADGVLAREIAYYDRATIAAQEGAACDGLAAECPAVTPEANVAVVRRFFEEGVNGGDLDVFDTVVAPDVIYYGATVGDESGLEVLKRIYGEALTGFPGIQYSLLTSVASEDAVAVRYLVEGVHSGDFRGLAPTGNTITWNHSAFARVECGQITEMWAEVNQLDRLSQLGTLTDEGAGARMAGASAYPASTPEMARDSASCTPQSPENVVAIVNRLRAEVYNGGNLDALPEIVTEGYLHGSANGPDAIGIIEGAQRIGGYLTAFPDLEWTFDEVTVQGNQMAARWTIRGTHDGDLLGHSATGNPVEFTGISFFTVQCGKILEFQTEMDAAGLLEQVGATVRRES